MTATLSIAALGAGIEALIATVIWMYVAIVPDLNTWIRYKQGAGRWEWYDTYHDLSILLDWQTRVAMIWILWPYELHCFLDRLVHKKGGGVIWGLYLPAEIATWTILIQAGVMLCR